MPQLEGADTGPAPGAMTDEQMSKAKQTRYFTDKIKAVRLIQEKMLLILKNGFNPQICMIIL